jgi:hypothetical protein
MRCQYCDGTIDIIYSGIDAFVLGVEVEKTCYPCADIRNRLKEGDN